MPQSSTDFTSSSDPPEIPDIRSAVASRSNYSDDDKHHAQVTETKLQNLQRGTLSEDLGEGVRMARATTIAWSRNALILAYALIFLIFFVNSFQQQIASQLTTFVTSSFQQQGLTATTGIVANLIAGIVKLPTAKLMDIWGRPQGYVAMLLCAVIGLILMASCHNVEQYAAGQVFYWVGFDGIAFVLDVFIADTSSLRSRALMFAFSTSPYIATTFAGPAAAQSFQQTSGWPWAYGTFAILTPVISLPFLTIFWWNQRLAKQQGIIEPPTTREKRTLLQAGKHYLIEFDIIGIILLSAGFALFLLPFSLASSQATKWRSGSMIAMLVIGFSCLILFAVHEKFTASRPFLPFHFLVDRTVLGACFLAGILFFSFYCWDAYFTTFLQVVYGVSIANAGYIANIYSIGSCFFALFVGALVYWSGRFKWIALVAVPLQVAGTGLMIYFRQPDKGIGFVVMCQIFIACSGGALVITQQMAAMAAVGPEHVASVLALLALFNAVGGAIGSTVSAAIWTNTLPRALAYYLPDEAQANASAIYASIETALSYPMGSDTREGIIAAYGYTQKFMCIAGTAVLVLALFSVLVWRDLKVKDFRKTKGSTIV